MIGRTIGKYRIVSQLGRGSSGTVYKAVDATLDREVAIKILNPELAETEVMQRFRAEATTLAKLNHPEIATVYELVQCDSDIVIAMELVGGETLEKVSHRLGPMPADRAACVIDKILSALEYAHRVGIVHRDLKPSNVMLTEDGRLKIMDFGVARVRDAEHMTVDGTLIGTPAYMSPEQVRGQDIDERSDLYAVGVVLYRLLTGALPFKADTAIAMLQKQISEAPTPLQMHRADLPDWCDMIVQRALAKAPADRFQSAKEFRETLGSAIGMIATAEVVKGFAIAETDVDVMKANPRMSDADEGRSSHAWATVGTSKTHFARSIAKQVTLTRVVFAGLLTVALTYLGTTSAMRPAKEFPVMVFEAKALTGEHERDAQLLLADGKVTVTIGNAKRPLHSVAFERVTSISYVRGYDPVWKSPNGRRRVGRGAGVLGILPRQRHWITLRTDDDRFIILWFNEALVRTVLAALEERTGRTADLLAHSS